MGALEQLVGIAQIAATYSGFIAIFIAFVGKDGRFASSDGHFVQAMVLSTIGVIVLALAPPALSLVLPEASMWFDMTLFAVIGGLPSVAFQAWQQVREARDKTQRIAATWHVPGWLFGIGAFACFFAGLIRPEMRAGFYVSGVTLTLAVSIWCFIAIVFRKFF